MKRKNGEGTWGTKTIKGVQYKYFRNSDGKYFYGKTEKEVKEKIKNYEKANSNLNSDKSYLSDFMKESSISISFRIVVNVVCLQ